MYISVCRYVFAWCVSGRSYDSQCIFLCVDMFLLGVFPEGPIDMFLLGAFQEGPMIHSVYFYV